MEQWSSRFGFVLAAIGAAVGLGNVWRFPAVVGTNGGGAYLVPYLLAAFAFALPLMVLEISVGRSLRADIITACRQVRRRFEVVGWIVGASVLLVLSYYLVITGWVLAFFVFELIGRGIDFASFTGTNQPILFFLISAVIVGLIVSLGVQNGIERMAGILIPLTFLILLLLAVYSITLEGFVDGIRFFLTPDTSALGDPLIWGAAFGQVFFSFSVGMGVLLTYGSYLGDDANVPRSAVVIACADLTVAFLSGIVIFAIVFTVGLEPGAGTELAFTTLPTGFEAMPFGSLLAVSFFGVLFVAAIAPSVSMLEVGVAGTMRATNWSRRKASLVITSLIVVAGLPSAASYSAVELHILGAPFLDVLDASVGTYALPLGALAIIFVFTWVQDQHVVEEQLGLRVLRPVVAYVVPAVLLIVLGLRIATDLAISEWQRVPNLDAPGEPGIVATLVLGVGIAAVIGIVLQRWRHA